MEKTPSSPAIIVRASLLFGALWGLAEATLGYLLHLLPIVLPVPSLSGYILFPVGFLMMYSALSASGNLAAAPLTALVAAAVKLASLLLPGVPFALVRNPALAIIAEGAISSVALGLFTLAPALKTAFVTLGVSVAWRMAFLLSLIALGIRGGILTKGTSAIILFLLAESAVNSALITAALHVTGKERIAIWSKKLTDLRPAFIALAGTAAIAAQIAFGTA